MSTKIYDKHGNLVKESDTEIPKDGYGPRDKDGRRLRGPGAEPASTENAPSAAPAAEGPARADSAPAKTTRRGDATATGEEKR